MSNRPPGLNVTEFFIALIILSLSCHQVCRILENDCIGFTVMNRGKDVLRIEKDGQHVAYISVWSKQDLSDEGVRQ